MAQGVDDQGFTQSADPPGLDVDNPAGTHLQCLPGVPHG